MSDLIPISFFTFDSDFIALLERFREAQCLLIQASTVAGDREKAHELAAIRRLTHSELVKRFCYSDALEKKCMEIESLFGFADDEVISLTPAFASDAQNAA